MRPRRRGVAVALFVVGGADGGVGAAATDALDSAAEREDIDDDEVAVDIEDEDDDESGDEDATEVEDGKADIVDGVVAGFADVATVVVTLLNLKTTRRPPPPPPTLLVAAF
jgi:hypothetical protein